MRDGKNPEDIAIPQHIRRQTPCKLARFCEGGKEICMKDCCCSRKIEEAG
jgi:hypothetical protein